jgi:spore photoproduct lyase
VIPRFDRLVIEDRVSSDPLALRVEERLERNETIITDDPGSFTGPGTFILKYHEGRFVKDFPVTPGAPPCGEKYIAALQGCVYDCSYCYLRSYLNDNSMTLLVNSRKMEEDIRNALSTGTVRFTTGELSDSLALDHITEITSSILAMLPGTKAVIEARTKSANVGHLPGMSGTDTELAREHLLVTWTLSPPEAVTSEEPGTAPLDERIEAISRISAAGIRYALRLDPVIPFYWDAGSYREMLIKVKEAAASGPMRIELGVLRFPPGLADSVRKDLPFSPVLRGEYVRDREGKIRLYRPLRIGIYREAAGIISDLFPGSLIELSQEDRTVWEDSGLEPPAVC